MLLVIDVGNTHTVLGLYDGATLLHHFRIESAKGRTSDEYQVLLSNLVQMAGMDRTTISASILSCVVPALGETFLQAVRGAFHHDMLVVGPGIKTGMPILYENPREVGADRIVNAIAAYERVRGAVISVDFGTSTNFDVVSPRGEFLGGIIAPGLMTSAEALFARAAKLPRTEIVRPDRVLGRNTIHSMQSGIVYGYVGLVDGLVMRLKQELGYPCTVLATGGLAGLIHAESQLIDAVEPFLTLEGLRLLYERNL